MKMQNILESIGFNIYYHELVCQVFTTDMLFDITSREFGHPYEDMQDMICGNLYLWLQQSYNVLWRIDEENGKVVIYHNTTDKLGERFATLLKISKEEGKLATHEMVKTLALSNYIIENVVFKKEGNWLMKNRNPQLSGLLKHFLFWLATLELNENENALKGLKIFMKKFAKEVDLETLKEYSTDEVCRVFITCFFHNINDVNFLITSLKNPNVSLSEV